MTTQGFRIEIWRTDDTAERHGQWYWHAKRDGNHRILADGGEGYHHRADLERSVHLLFGPDVPIEHREFGQ